MGLKAFVSRAVEASPQAVLSGDGHRWPSRAQTARLCSVYAL